MHRIQGCAIGSRPERSAQSVLGIDECAAEGEPLERLVEHQGGGERLDAAGAGGDT